MSDRIVTIVLGLGLALSVSILLARASGFALPGNHQGFEPVQPIAFSHGLHAGELQVDCRYCHSGAETSRFAGIPAASVCMNCHRFVTASVDANRIEEAEAGQEGRASRPVVSTELDKLYRALGLDPQMQPSANRAPTPIAWAKVHDLPDFVYFDHRAHVTADVSCQQCHGPVETMERVRQIADLSMGWCVSCHRENQVAPPAARDDDGASRPIHASLDCATCHY